MLVETQGQHSPGSTVPDVRTLEIAVEQQVVDRVYARLEGMRAQAGALAGEGHRRAAAGPATGLVERDALVHRAAAQLRALDAEEEGIVFGRLDLDDGETYRIGRLGVRDGLEPLLIDWRAPAAAPFYRATSGEPLGVVRRRVVICRGPEVVDRDEDVLSPDDAGDLRVLGEGALLAALRRSRGPQMRDIVTTIQREQDDAMRAPLAELMWQTPPGAPERLRLVYAGQVLTLGPDDLAAARRRVRARCATTGTKPNAARPTAAAVLLGALWSRVDGAHLGRELFAEEVGDRGEFRRFLQAWWPVLTPAKVLSWLADDARVIGLAASAAGTLAASYRARPDWSVDDVPLLDELAGLLGDPPATPKAPEPEWRLRELTTGTRQVGTFVLACGLRDGWELYAPWHPTPIALAGPAIDNDAVAAAQRWAEAVILREGHRVLGWTDGFDPHGEEGYVPVLAEPLPVEEVDDAPALEPYLHVILDEAQDLSPMECRMIARRAEHASMTIVGDLGQATHPLAAASWSELLTRLGKREVRTLELHTGYRVPQVIADYAARILAPGITPTRSYRPGGTLSVRKVDDLHAALREAVHQAPPDATVAVIAADDALIDLPSAAVVPASLIKGLEYDHVIVVEPADIVAAEPRGLNRLYVALTRAVTSLVILHQKTLPDALSA